MEDSKKATEAGIRPLRSSLFRPVASVGKSVDMSDVEATERGRWKHRPIRFPFRSASPIFLPLLSPPDREI
ncbi:hypothetical protein GCM10007897_27500 [Sphingobium jiangsuense]|nr:hypothetical protein GCM10007897_27500 [Sphingobium jiangsuense]